MFFLKILSFCAGSFVLFAAPFLMLSERQGWAEGGVLTVLAASLAVLLFAVGYFFFALAGHRAGRSTRARLLGAALIVFQLIAGAVLLSTSRNPDLLIASAPLLSFSVFLFMAFIWPGDSARNHRPMRRREHGDQYHVH